MNRIIQNIKKNTLLSVIAAILLGLTVLVASKYLAHLSKGFVKQFFELNFYTGNTIGKLYMLIFSIGLIWLINNKSLKNYGFKLPKNLKYLKPQLDVRFEYSLNEFFHSRRYIFE